MSSTAELAELHDLVSGLRRCVASLRSRYVDNPDLRRVTMDADRILSDLDLLDGDLRDLDLSRCTEKYSGEKIQVPDTQYDNDFWRGVDDEGVGGRR